MLLAILIQNDGANHKLGLKFKLALSCFAQKRIDIMFQPSLKNVTKNTKKSLKKKKKV